MDASVSEDLKNYEIKNMNLVSSSLKFFLLFTEIDPFVFHEDIIRVTTVRFNFPKVAERDNRTVYLNYYYH